MDTKSKRAIVSLHQTNDNTNNTNDNNNNNPCVSMQFRPISYLTVTVQYNFVGEKRRFLGFFFRGFCPR